MNLRPEQRSLRELVQEFNNGIILLPQFQRDYVWTAVKIRNLLDSLLKGYPIGSFYLWKPGSGAVDAKSKAFGRPQFAKVVQAYLIDGQQRLTSLEAAFGLYIGEDKGGAELRCFLDLAAFNVERARTTPLFVTYAGNATTRLRVENGDPTLIALDKLFDGTNPDLYNETQDALTAARWSHEKIATALQRLERAGRMLEQSVPCIGISDVNDQEAVEVFSRLNKGGSALRQGDVEAAELARSRAVNVLKSMREFVAGDRPKRLGFGFSFAFRTLVLFHQESAQFKSLKPDWVELKGPNGSLSQSWRAAERAIDKALEFIDVMMGWSRRALVPSANAIIVFAAALDRANLRITDEDAQLYRRWLCLTALRGVFQASVETVINRFYRATRDATTGVAKALGEALTRQQRGKIAADEINRYAQPWGPPTQVMHAWLVSQGARDWLIDESIDGLARQGGPNLPGGDLTVHHLFPRKVLADLQVSPNEANSPANYALLSRSTNSEFKDWRPEDVLAKLTPGQRKVAAAQFFGEAAGDRLRNYSDFCEWRAKQIATSMNQWLGLSDAGA